MHPRNLLRTVFAVAIALTFACSLIPTPQPAEPPTLEPSSPQTDFDEAKVTDSEGVVIFEDAGSPVAIKVQIQDDQSNSAVQGIQVQVLSKGPDVVVIALDPKRVYMPTWEVIKPTSSGEGVTYVSFGVSSAHAQNYLAVALRVIKYVGFLEAGNSVIQYFKDMPDIRRFAENSIDQCFTGPQLAKFFNSNADVALALVPIPSIFKDSRIQQVVETIWEVVSTSSRQDVDIYLQSLPDTYLFRIHILPNPKFNNVQSFVLSLMPLEYLGSCESQSGEQSPQPPATVLPTDPPISENPSLYLNQTSNCREGPSPAYEVVYSFEAGTQFEIIGKYGSGWWLVPIDLSFTRKKSCWIYEEGNTILGDVSNVPNVEPSPLPPTEAPEPSGEMPIYDFYSQSIIDYMSCSEASNYEWESDVWSETGEAVYFSSALFGNAAYGVYERDAREICGW